jgi:sec-independent protein translocase protein TatB
MFGIGLPEMILILALALIVVGPDKLPDLARSLAKGILELKKTAEGLKASFAEEGNPLDEIRPELEDAARSLKNNLLEQPAATRETDSSFPGINPLRQTQPVVTTTDIDAEYSAVETAESSPNPGVADQSMPEESYGDEEIPRHERVDSDSTRDHGRQ